MPRRLFLFGAALALLSGCGGSQPPPPTTNSSAPAAAHPSAGSPPVAATQFANSADGVPIAWHQYGHGDPAVVLIHGWALNSGLWREQLAALAARYTVITLDLGGQGASGSQRDSWSISNYAHDVSAVVAALAQPHVVLVGQGMGGPVALEAAPLIGGRLAGIVGVETFRTLGRPPPLASQTDSALEPFRQDFAAAVRQFVKGTLFQPRSDPATVQTVAALMGQTTPERGLAGLTELNRLDYASILPAVKVRMVVIDSDLGGAPDEARLHRTVPRLQLVILKGDDSFPMLTDSGRFNSTLMQAIDSLTAP